MALPLSLHHDEDRSILLSDSEDDDLLPAPRRAREQTTPNLRERDIEAMRQKNKDAAANIPTHPIPAMQPAFAESLIEATNTPALEKPKLRYASGKERRNHLLDGAKNDPLHGELWRYRPGQHHHELWKLMAQISFGVYLMLNGIANSNEQVVAILQGHINEVDEFLETTLEDVTVAIQDIQERIDYLKLPMENIKTLEQMLEDRTFRLQIVTGNEKIEHIIARTTTALEAIVGDVNQGMGATKHFAAYLGEQENRAWRRQRPEIGDIFDAMRGNAQGWYKTLVKVQGKLSILRALLDNIDRKVAELNYRAGEVSRRTRASVAPFSSPVDQPLPNNNSRNSSMRSFDQRPRLELSKSMSQKSVAGSTGTRSTVMIVQFNAPIEPMSPVELEGDTIPKTIVTIEEDPEAKSEAEKADSPVDEGLFILQPRTYTPQPPAPIPSPRIQDPPAQDPPIQDPPIVKQEEQPKRTSLRQRLSLRGSNLPEAIQVPTRHTPELQKPVYPSVQQQQSPRYQSPRIYQGPDSAYGSDNEARPPIVRSITDYADIAEMPVPNFPTGIPSPRSDQQHYFPVRASPHSPLQQRPWTAGTNVHSGHHIRNQPSAMGLSVLSNVTTLSPEQKTIKKKRSAFGWLKKAFSLDEEERAEFEARRAQQAPNPYYEGRSPKFLDGKRLPEYRRH